MAEPLVVKRKDGESDAEFAARVAEMLRQPSGQDDEQY